MLQQPAPPLVSAPLKLNVGRSQRIMQKKTFSTFRDASNYARQHAQDIGATVRLERVDDHWMVVAGQEGAPTTSGNQNRYMPPSISTPDVAESSWWEEEQECRDLEQKHREIERKVLEAERREREKRRPYLKERENYYRSLPEAELDKLWNQREQMNLESDETALLREIVRKVKGIKPVYGNSVQVCPQCGMVGGNCTCGRSWF